MRRDGFCFACALEDEELRENGDGLEEDGERPEDLCDGVAIVEDECKDECGPDEVLDAEGVDGRVVCGAKRERRVGSGRVKNSAEGGNGLNGNVPKTNFHQKEDV